MGQVVQEVKLPDVKVSVRQSAVGAAGSTLVHVAGAFTRPEGA